MLGEGREGKGGGRIPVRTQQALGPGAAGTELQRRAVLGGIQGEAGAAKAEPGGESALKGLQCRLEEFGWLSSVFLILFISLFVCLKLVGEILSRQAAY